MLKSRFALMKITVLAVFFTGCAVSSWSAPVVGLAGNKYRYSYAPVLEKLGIQAQTVPGTVLEDPDAVGEYTAFVIVSRSDPGRDDPGLSEKAEQVLEEYVRNGGRLLLTLGATPPKAIVTGNFQNFGHGPHWRVADIDHPITEGYRQGQGIQYGRYRGGIRNLGDNGRVLVTETSGHPAVIVAEHGAGAVIYTIGDLGHAAHYDKTTGELQDRVLRYLAFGKVQDRFGPQLTSRGPLKHYEPVHTPRELATEGNGQAQVVCSADFSQSPALDIRGGYALDVGDGEAGVWSITAPEGQQVFSPWHTIELGSGKVEAGERYSLCGEVRLSGVNADQFAAAHYELRFYDSGGTELPHEHFATVDPEPGQWETLCVEDVAPENAVSARVYMTFMLPAGKLQLRSASIEKVLTTEKLMAAEEPLTTGVPHPRLLPEAAADFEAWVSNTETGVYNASRADIFAEIQKQADEYMQEEEMIFGDTSIPWPPEEMPEGEGGTRWNPMTSGISARLVELSLTYQGTGEEKYGRRAVELLLAISNWPVWYDPVNNRPSLDVGRMSMGAGWAYDLCYDLMTPQERKRAAAAIKRNTLIPLYDALSQGKGNLNSSALWMIGLGSCAVATLGDVEGASMCVRAVEDFALGQLDVRATSHPIEGQGYDSWAYGNMLMVLNALKRNFAVDHFDHPFLSVIPKFAINFLGNDRKQHAWLEDAGGTTTYVHWHYPLAILGAVNDDPYAGWYLKETGTVNSPRQRPFRLLFFDPATPVKAPEADRPGQVFPKAGWASLRSGWEPGGTFIAFVCSDSGTGHAQRHQNHFLTYRDDVLMTTDCGYASGRRGALREYTRGTVGHNSVLVDNTNQMYKLGRIPHFVSNTWVDYVMGDATAAYSPSLLQRFHRHLIYVKPDLLFVIDQLAADVEPRTFQWVLHPNSRLHMAESVAVDGQELQVGGDPVKGTVEVQKQGKTMRVRSLYPQDMAFRYLVYEGAEQYNPYLQIDHPPAEEAVMVNLLEFGDTTAENVQTHFSGGTVSVTFDSGGDAYTVQLTPVAENGSGPRIEVTRNGEPILETDEPGIPEDAIG